MRHDLFPPGEYIRDELDARNWTQEDLAGILGRPLKTVNQIVSAKKGITPQTAQELGAAFGTSAEVWLNLESAYRLGLDRKEQEDVARRARLYEIAPVNDMIRRRWIARPTNVAELEVRVLQFLEIESLDEEPSLAAAARKSTSYGATTAAQMAWLFRVKHLARTLKVKPYSAERFASCAGRLRSLAADERKIREVPALLAEIGIRLVVVEHLPRTKIDGAALWLDESSPVMAVSLRHGRIDAFWHTLAHELMHIKYRDRDGVDNDLIGRPQEDGIDEEERRADREASEFLVSADSFDSFIARLRPRFSKKRIVQFANLHGIHPGIVVGQLQYRGAIKYSHSREMLVNVREVVTDAALTDGWGYFPGI